MKNLSLYLTLGILLGAKTYAASAKDSINIAFSGFHPEISLGEKTMVSGFSAVTNTGLDVTYNNKSELSKNDIKKTPSPSHVVTKAPPFREATIDEPLVINDWTISFGTSPEIPEIKEQNNDFRRSATKKDETITDIVIKDEKKETPTVSTEEHDKNDDYASAADFDLNDIKSTKNVTGSTIEDEGMGVINVVNSLFKEKQPETKISDRSDTNKKKTDDYENDAEDIPLKIKDDVVKKPSSLQNAEKSSPWAIATVRGQTSNRLATIGNEKDISKYITGKGIFSPYNNGSWDQKSSVTEERNAAIAGNSQKYDYKPDAKINQWSMREMIYRPSVTEFSDSEFTSTKIATNNTYDFDDRWINEPKAVLINSISSKPLPNKSKQSETDTNLKSDERKEVRDAKPKRLLTKIEDTGKEESSVSSDNTFITNTSNDTDIPEKDEILPNSHISLNEIRLNFKPGYADLSMPSIRLLSAFAGRVATIPTAVIEIRISDNSAYLQSKRLTIVKQLLQTNGVDRNRIVVTKSDRDIDTMIIRNLSSSNKQTIKNEIKIKEKIKKW